MKQKSIGIALTVLAIGFFMFGFLTSINDVLAARLKEFFNLSYGQAMLVQFCFFAAYAVTSIPIGKLVSEMGHKHGISLGFILMALGCLVFLPAAHYKTYSLFLLGIFILAVGVTLLQVTCNAYAFLLGDAATAARRVTLMHAFNAVGKMSAPIFGAFFIVTSGVVANSLPSLNNIQMPYLGLTLFLLAVAILINFMGLPQIRQDAKSADLSGRQPSFWHYKHLVLGWVALFAAVGSEWSVSSCLINYFELPTIGNMTATLAAKYLTLFWLGELIGRFSGSYYLGKIKPNKALVFNGLAAICLIFISMVSQARLAIWSILLVGLCNSIMVPSIISLAVRGLGTWTTKAAGILCVAIIGGGVVALARGIVADYIGLQLAFIVPMLCYFFIVYYGLSGYDKKFANI